MPSLSTPLEGASLASIPGSDFVLHPGVKATYIYGCGEFACVWYAKGHNKKVGEITGFSNVEGISVSPVNGDVYIADFDGQIFVYAPNSTTLIADYPDPIRNPIDVAVDSAGNFYVANVGYRGIKPSVAVFNPSGTLIRTLHDPSVVYPVSVAIDEHKLLLLCFENTNEVGECDEFPNARGHGVQVALGFGFPGGSAFDAAEHFVVIDPHNANADSFSGSTMCGKYDFEEMGEPSWMAFSRSDGVLYTSNAAIPGITAHPYIDCGSGVLQQTFAYNDGLGPQGFLRGVAVTPMQRP